jgi:multidrug efflux pump subunit AcrB
MTGHTGQEVYIGPDHNKLISMNLTVEDIEAAVTANNINIGSILVRDGKYLYNLEFSTYLSDLEEIRKIPVKAGSRIFRLGDIAEVGFRQQQPRGMYHAGKSRGLALAIIKESSAQMSALKESMETAVEQFKAEYPNVNFSISQDQTRLLDYSLSNLKQSLWAGGLLAFFLMFFFLRDGKSPLIIGLSIPATLVISLLFFHLAGLSINIISLAGLILGIGMMIDNSIVVIENITQWNDRGLTLSESCVKGTDEVIAPLISSVLTTCAVFVPLIFLSGIAGALFYDQAIAIIIGQGVSLLVGVTLLPVMYNLLYRNGKRGVLTRLVEKISFKGLENRYENGMKFFFRYSKSVLLSFAAIMVLMVWLFSVMKKERFPAMKQDEVVLSIDWNENIDIVENQRRTASFLDAAAANIEISNTFSGEQRFTFTRDYEQSYTESTVYIKANSIDDARQLRESATGWFRSLYPDAVVSVYDQKNIFEKIFSSDEVPLIAEVSMAREKVVPPPQVMEELTRKMMEKWPGAGITMPAVEEKISLRTDPSQLLLYNVSQASLFRNLRTSFNRNNIGLLRSSHEIIPIVISDSEKTVDDIISSGFVRSGGGRMIPYRDLVEVDKRTDYKAISGGLSGEYVPVNMQFESNNPDQLIQDVRKTISENPSLDVSFSGGLVSGQKLFRELMLVLAISLVLLYFILAAQFESLSQPFIVLLEIPIDIAGALLLVKLWGGTINIMTMIGLIVMSGVIINDSILKVDTINNLRKEGYSLKAAIFEGGSRRLKPIIMVALASLVSTFPILFSNGMGAELQRPMSLALIGGMSLGTFVSLYFIPLAYWFIYRKMEEKKENKTIY